MAKKYLIALDDGHGMETPGKRTPPLTKDLYINGKLVRKKGEVIKENEFNQAVVKYLAAALKRCGFNVLIVAPTNYDTPLSTRVRRANNAKADAYISKHYNAIGGKWQSRAKGLVTIIHYRSSSTSKRLADNVHKELLQLHKKHNCKNYGVRTDKDVSGFSLYVLKNTNMPAILTESGFMDYKIEAEDMLDPAFQKADAEGTCKGICKTFNVKYIPPGDEKVEEKEKVIEEVETNVKRIKVIVDELNIRNAASWDKDAVSGTIKKGETYEVDKKIKIGKSFMYKLKSGYFVTASSKYVEVIENKQPVEENNENKETVEEKNDTKYVKVLVDELNIRSKPSWDKDAVSGTVKKGEVFTVVEKVKVDKSYMYKLKSGSFITASSKYVEEIKK